MFFVSFEGAPEDPLLRADIAKRDKAREALNDEAANKETNERPVVRDSAENVEAAVENKTIKPNEEEEEEREKTLAKEVRIFLNLISLP